MDSSKLNTRVTASTIMEVVVSMVIIVVVFGIAMMIYTNVVRYSLSAKKTRAQAILQEVLLKAADDPDPSTQTFSLDDFRIEQEVKAYPNGKGLSSIHLTAYDQNQRKIAEAEKVIINSHE